MSSVHVQSGKDLQSTTLPTLSSDWGAGGWFRANAGEYGGAGEHVLFYLGRGGATGGNEGGIAIDIGATNNTTISFLSYTAAGGGPVFDAYTGSMAQWFFCWFQHIGGTVNYDVRYRLEGATAFSSHTLVNPAEFTANTSPQCDIGTDHAAEHALDSDVRHVVVIQSTLTDQQLLELSQNLYSVAKGSPLHDLNLINGASADVVVNRGSGSTWTVNGGPLTTTASEPRELLDRRMAQAERKAFSYPRSIVPPRFSMLGSGIFVDSPVQGAPLSFDLTQTLAGSTVAATAQTNEGVYVPPQPRQRGYPARTVAPPAALLGQGILSSLTAQDSAVVAQTLSGVTVVATAQTNEGVPAPPRLRAVPRALGFPGRSIPPGLPVIGKGNLIGQPAAGGLVGDATLAGVTVVATATVEDDATVAQTLAGATVAATATAEDDATLAQTLPGVSVAATLVVTPGASMPLAQAKALGYPAFSKLPGFFRIGAGILSPLASADLAVLDRTLSGVSVAATATVEDDLTLSVTLGGVTVTATAQIPNLTAPMALPGRRARGFPGSTTPPGFPRLGSGILAPALSVDIAELAQTLAGVAASATLGGSALTLAQTLAGATVTGTMTAEGDLALAVTLGGVTGAATAQSSVPAASMALPAQRGRGYPAAATPPGFFRLGSGIYAPSPQAAALQQTLAGVQVVATLEQGIATRATSWITARVQADLPAVLIDVGLPAPVFVVGDGIAVGEADVLTWRGIVLTWRGEPLTWRRRS